MNYKTTTILIAAIIGGLSGSVAGIIGDSILNGLFSGAIAGSIVGYIFTLSARSFGDPLIYIEAFSPAGSVGAIAAVLTTNGGWIATFLSCGLGWVLGLILPASLIAFTFDEQTESDSLPAKNISKIRSTSKTYEAKSFMFDEGDKPCAPDSLKVAVGEMNKRSIEQIKKSNTLKKWSFFTRSQSIKNNLTGKIYIQGEYEFSPLRGEPGIRILTDGKDSWAAHIDTEYVNESSMPEQAKSSESLPFDATNPKLKEKIYINKLCPFCRGNISKPTMICEKCGTGFPKEPESHIYDIYLDNTNK